MELPLGPAKRHSSRPNKRSGARAGSASPMTLEAVWRAYMRGASKADLAAVANHLKHGGDVIIRVTMS